MGKGRWGAVLAGGAVAVLLTLPGALGAQESGHSHGGGEAANLQETAAEIERITDHFVQMRTAVEENPSLEAQWATPPVLKAVEDTGILTSEVAELVVALSAHLDGALASEAVRSNHAVAERLTVLQGDVDALAGVLAEMGVKIHGFENDFHAH